MTEYETSGDQYSQKSGWINHSNERIFQVICIHSVVLPVVAYIAQSLIGEWRRIVMADPEGRIISFSWDI